VPQQTNTTNGHWPPGAEPPREAEPDPHAEIARLEAEIEERSEAIERCRKVILLSKVAATAGALVVILLLLGIVPPDATTLIVSIVGFLLFTPSLWLTLTVNGVQQSSPSNVLRVITIVLLIAPVVCMVLNSTGRLVLGKPKAVA